MNRFLHEAASVVPSPRQLSWFSMGSYAFLHFGMNTFTDREWGTGDEPESLFNPVKLDCSQWAETIRAAGFSGMILVAKHHDGFCLWDTKTTGHCVMNSPLHRDVVKEASAACRRAGLKFGFYLSPWDRNCPLYGTDAYNDFYCEQLTELLTGYGEIFEVWFDNACGEGPGGKKQNYDFPRYIELVRKYQPNAVIFNDCGPDVRWCGNEAGKGRRSEWAVVPKELCRWSKTQSGPGPLSGEGDLSFVYNSDEETGSLPQILYSKGLVFAPSEVDTSIRPGWFWHEKEEPKSVEELFHIYLESAGHNACLNLNIPPDRNGLLDERDVRRLLELGDCIRSQFGTQTVTDVEKLSCGYPTQPQYLIRPDREKPIRYVLLREDLTHGQRVESFRICVKTDRVPSGLFPVYQGTTIGSCQICPMKNPYSDQLPAGSELILQITAARGEVFLKSIEVY